VKSKSNTLSLREEHEAPELSDEDAASFFIARQILQEIRNFGVNQKTNLKLIELLALELENRERMLAVINALKGVGPAGSSLIVEE
jgi:type III secretion system FlhB-like substrate exporter